jgi:hypothetical protein
MLWAASDLARRIKLAADRAPAINTSTSITTAVLLSPGASLTMPDSQNAADAAAATTDASEISRLKGRASSKRPATAATMIHGVATSSALKMTAVSAHAMNSRIAP